MDKQNSSLLDWPRPVSIEYQGQAWWINGRHSVNSTMYSTFFPPFSILLPSQNWLITFLPPCPLQVLSCFSLYLSCPSPIFFSASLLTLGWCWMVLITNMISSYWSLKITTFLALQFLTTTHTQVSSCHHPTTSTPWLKWAFQAAPPAPRWTPWSQVLPLVMSVTLLLHSRLTPMEHMDRPKGCAGSRLDMEAASNGGVAEKGMMPQQGIFDLW